MTPNYTAPDADAVFVRLIRTFGLSLLSYRTHEIGSGNFSTGPGTWSLDPASARASCARRRRTEILGRSLLARVAGEWLCLARRRSWSGQNAHRQNNCLRYPDRLPAPAIHPGSSTGRFNRHPYLQPARRSVHDQVWPNFFEPHPGRRNQSCPCQSTERLTRSDAGAPGDHWRKNVPAFRSVSCSSNAKPTGAGRHLSAPRSAARSFHVQVEHRLSAETGGAPYSRFNGDVRTRSECFSSGRSATHHRSAR